MNEKTEKTEESSGSLSITRSGGNIPPNRDDEFEPIKRENLGKKYLVQEVAGYPA